jgi:hypothetical protein
VSGVIFIYAHARVGMFLPLLERSKINNGASLLGATVQVWTSNDLLSTYKIVRVRRHVTSLDGAFTATTERLWVDTSEGPRGTHEKLILVASRIGSVPSSHAAAHPRLIRSSVTESEVHLAGTPWRGSGCPFLPARTSVEQLTSESPG